MRRGKKAMAVILLLLMSFSITLPTWVFAAETMSDEFKSYLNEDGKFVVNSVEPTSIDKFLFIAEMLYYDTEETVALYKADEDSDFTSAEMILHPGTDKEETHTVSLVYKYDANIKSMVDGYIKRIPEDKKRFAVTDMEVINFIYNGKGDSLNLIKYSGELKEYIDYKNFSVDVRMGNDDRFFTEAAGEASFMYEHTIYGMLTGDRGAIAEHVIYVPDSTADTKEALMQAAQKRIDEHIGKDKVTLSYEGTGIYDLYMDEYTAELEEWQSKLDEVTARLEALSRTDPEYGSVQGEEMVCIWWVRQYQDYIDHFEQGWKDGEYSFLKDAAGDFYFNAKVFAGTEDETDYKFIIIKDSSKMVNPIIKTSDVKTDITITPADSAIPLDTLIQANKLTSGSEYENIIKILDVENSEMFDLTLYSGSISQNITSGNFEVKIPIPDKLNGKALTVYYVGADNKIEEHEVTVKDDYAIFTTNHFSIYTLAESKADQKPAGNDSKNDPDETKSPNTGDFGNEFTWMAVVLFSAAAVFTSRRKSVKY